MSSDPLYQGVVDFQDRGGGIMEEIWFALGSSWGRQVGGVGGWECGGMFRCNIAFTNRKFALLVVPEPTPSKPC